MLARSLETDICVTNLCCCFVPHCIPLHVRFSTQQTVWGRDRGGWGQYLYRPQQYYLVSSCSRSANPVALLWMARPLFSPAHATNAYSAQLFSQDFFWGGGGVVTGVSQQQILPLCANLHVFIFPACGLWCHKVTCGTKNCMPLNMGTWPVIAINQKYVFQFNKRVDLVLQGT